MELKRCSDCKLLYSVSYRTCPFCEEERQLKEANKKRSKRRVSEKKPVHSARGAMILILIFVLLVLSWYLFGDLLFDRTDVEPDPPVVEDPIDPNVEPDPPVIDPDEPVDPEPDEPDEPVPSLSKEDLSLRTIYGPVAKATEDEDADYDLSMSLRDGTIQFSVDGTDESVAWGSENESIVVVDGTGTIKPKAVGKTVVTGTVGGVTLRCIVRVSG